MALEEGVSMSKGGYLFIPLEQCKHHYVEVKEPASMRERHELLLKFLRENGMSDLADRVENKTKRWRLYTRQFNDERQESCWGYMNVDGVKEECRLNQRVEGDYTPLLWSRGEAFLCDVENLAVLDEDKLFPTAPIPRFRAGGKHDLVILFRRHEERVFFQVAMNTFEGLPPLFVTNQMVLKLLSAPASPQLFSHALESVHFHVAMGIHRRFGETCITVRPLCRGKLGRDLWFIVINTAKSTQTSQTDTQTVSTWGKCLTLSKVLVGKDGVVLTQDHIDAVLA